jgi:hypothetical protein
LLLLFPRFENGNHNITNRPKPRIAANIAKLPDLLKREE